MLLCSLSRIKQAEIDLLVETQVGSLTRYSVYGRSDLGQVTFKLWQLLDQLLKCVLQTSGSSTNHD